MLKRHFFFRLACPEDECLEESEGVTEGNAACKSFLCVSNSLAAVLIDTFPSSLWWPKTLKHPTSEGKNTQNIRT